MNEDQFKWNAESKSIISNDVRFERGAYIGNYHYGRCVTETQALNSLFSTSYYCFMIQL